MYTLGINAAFHDSSACLVKDGEVVSAVEEERFTKIKHAKRPVPFSTWELPFHAMEYCLRNAGLCLSDIDHVAYAFEPHQLLNGQKSVSANRSTVEIPLDVSRYEHNGDWASPWDPLFLSAIVNAPYQLVDGAPLHLQKAFQGVSWTGPHQWHFVDHHLSHAASAFLPSPFDEAAVMSLDGRGELATTTYWRGRDTELEKIGEVTLPHSLGLLYESVTSYLGFLRSSDEYKVMALASYGRPVYLDAFRDIIRMEGEGRYTIEPLQLEYRFGPQRLRGAPLEQRHFDIAHSLQAALEIAVLELAQWLRRKSEAEYLCMAGGVALNCVMNARIRDSGIFEDIWVQPAAGDAGTALGAALWIDSQLRESEVKRASMNHTFYGPSFDDSEVEKFLRWSKLPYERSTNVVEEAADLLAEDRVIGWFQGSMEFGPRALGGRSILASPLHAEMQTRLNEIKDREDFRPVAPVVLEEQAGEWFENVSTSPYMLFVHRVKEGKADLIPAVRHVDGTARIQTIRREQNPPYYDLVRAFMNRTGVPVLINTSFNTRGEPIVCTPRDAIESFWTSPLDALVIGSFLVKKAEL